MIGIKDIFGNILLSISINEGCKRKFMLQKEDYILLRFSLEKPIYFKLGSYAECEFGLFEVCDLQNPTFNTNTAGYDYELRLDAHYWKWKNKIFKYTPETVGQEASWNLTAPLDVHAGIVLRNLKALGYKYKGLDFDFSIDTAVKDRAQLMTYDNINILDACFEMVKKWDCECWITENIIHFGKCEFGDAVDLEIAKNVAEMSRSESQSTYATRIYAFGSTRNIPTNYRPVDETIVVNGVVQKRLMLPVDTPYIEAYPDMISEEAVEQVVVFDDVYPRRVGTLSDVDIHEYTDTNKDTGEVTKWNAYRFKDTGIKFSEKYVLEGEELKITFQSGKLNGMTFAVTFNPCDKEGGEPSIPEKNEDGSWNPDAQVWEIIRNEDYGRKLPGDVLIPEDGDTYVLCGWDSTKIKELGLVDAAEKELKAEAEKYVEQSKIDPSTYTCKMMSDIVYDEGGVHNLLSIGDRVNLINKAYFENGRKSRVIGFEYSLDYPFDSRIYTVGETAAYSRIGELEEKIDNITLAGHTYTGGGGSGVYLIRRNDSTPPTESNVFSALRSIDMFLSKNKPDRAKKKITFEEGIGIGQEENGGIDGKGNAELLTLVVRELLRSPKFVDGFTGEGWKLWMEDALSHLTIDKLTVRRIMVVFEMLIEKVRSVGGQLCVSAANGKIKEVETEGSYTVIRFEQENTFVEHDLMRCKTFTGGSLKDYWVEVSASSADGIQVLTSEFEGYLPEPGDECVLMGNTQNPLRQNLINISATEDGQPRIDVLDGVNSKNFANCLRARLGNLDGIYDDWFPADNQPHGNGLYSDNAYLRGTFLLVTGEDILTKFEITEGKIQSAVEGLIKDVSEKDNYLNNSSFTSGLDKWDTVNDTVFFLLGNKWIWANDNVLSNKGDGASAIKDDGRNVVRIRNKYIVQNNNNLREKPIFKPNEDGLKEAVPVYLSFFYRCKEPGTLYVSFDNIDKTGFAPYNSMTVSEELAATDGYVQYTCEGLWNGTGDFHLSFTGEIYLYMLVLSTDKVNALTYKYRTLFEQSERLVKISAAVFDKDEKLLQETGLMVKAEGSGIYMQTADGKLALIGVTVEENGKTVIKLTAENIRLEGLVTANGNFKILEDGSIESYNGTFSGYIRTDFKDINKSDAELVTVSNQSMYRLKSNLNLKVDVVDGDTHGAFILLPSAEKYIGARTILWNGCMPPYTGMIGSIRYSQIQCEGGGRIMGTPPESAEFSMIDHVDALSIDWINGIIELMGVPQYEPLLDENGNYQYDEDGVLITKMICGWCIMSQNATSIKYNR